MKIKPELINIFLILIIMTPAVSASGKNVNETLLKMINSDGDETSCTVSSDQKMIIFSRKPKGAKTSDLYFSEFKKKKWSSPVKIDELNSESDELSPFFSADGNTLYFASDRQGSLKSGKSSKPSFDIYYSEKKKEKWGTPEQLFGVVNTMGDEIFPSLTPDGKTIYFTRSPAGSSKSLIIKVKKKNDFWEDVETAKIPGDPDYSAYMAVKSAHNSAFIFSGYKKNSKSRDIYFSEPSAKNDSRITENSVSTSEGDEISFFELNSSEMIVATNSGGNSGSYDLFLKKTSGIPVTVPEKPASEITINTEIRSYENSAGVNIKILFFKSEKPGLEPDKNEVKQPDSDGNIIITAESGIKRIVAIPGNDDMKEFALEIFPGKKIKKHLLIIEKKKESEFRLRPVYFEFNSSGLQVADIPYMHDLIEYLRKNESLNLRIEGYADGIGSYHSNRNISIARAEAVKEYLVQRGINKKRVTTAGNGFIKDQPKDTSQYNRRVEFIIK